MDVVALDDHGKEWDDFAQRVDDAWFWHTTLWMDYTREYSKSQFVRNASFSIVENNQMLAICPTIIERSTFAEDANQFSYSGGPIPCPAMSTDLSDKKRRQVLSLYVETLEAIAKREDVCHVSVRIPSVAKRYLTQDMPVANPLLRYGYTDLTYLTQVIDLRKDPVDLWGEVRKSAKALIKQARRQCQVRIWEQKTLMAEKFSDYQALHRKAAGRVTRSQETFDMMRDWVSHGLAALAEAEYQGQPVAFALLMLYQKGAYHGSACKAPDCQKLPASHLIQWESILWLKERGYHFYDLGLQQFHPQWFDIPSPKDISISEFKRAFGGRTIPLLTAEFFYSARVLEETLQRRVQAYLSARESVGSHP